MKKNKVKVKHAPRKKINPGLPLACFEMPMKECCKHLRCKTCPAMKGRKK